MRDRLWQLCHRRRLQEHKLEVPGSVDQKRLRSVFLRVSILETGCQFWGRHDCIRFRTTEKEPVQANSPFSKPECSRQALRGPEALANGPNAERRHRNTMKHYPACILTNHSNPEVCCHTLCQIAVPKSRLCLSKSLTTSSYDIVWQWN